MNFYKFGGFYLSSQQGLGLKFLLFPHSPVQYLVQKGMYKNLQCKVCKSLTFSHPILR
jgi:hypothetical protein